MLASPSVAGAPLPPPPSSATQAPAALSASSPTPDMVVPFNAPSGGSAAFADILSTYANPPAAGATATTLPAISRAVAPSIAYPQLAAAINAQHVGASAASPDAAPLASAGSGSPTGLSSLLAQPGQGAGVTAAPSPASLLSVLGGQSISAGTSLPAGAMVAYLPVLVYAPSSLNGSSVSAAGGAPVFSQPFSGSATVTQGFGPTIFSAEPAYAGYPHFHTGIDYGLPVNTPVQSAADGVVEFAGKDTTGFGTMVMVRHANGLETLYGHLNSVTVTAGQSIARGQEIGLSGNTGNSTGPHLHFGVRQNGLWIDPQVVLQTQAAMGATTTPLAVPSVSTSVTSNVGGGSPLAGVNSTLPQGVGVPSPLVGTINSAAQQNGVDPTLIAAIMQQESSFNPWAQSSSGAQGLMQLMPSTAQSLGVTNPFDPTQSIMGGTSYLSSLLSQFNGNVSLAVAAYNAGPNAVQQYGGIPPYTQTQQYVQNVLSNQATLAARAASVSGK